MAVVLKKAESNDPVGGDTADCEAMSDDVVVIGAATGAASVAVGDGWRGAASEAARPERAEANDASRGSLTSLRYRAIVVRHYRAVFRFAAALLGIEADAEDVTQETFTRYWQHGQSVERPREWLFRVARNLCLDRLRRSGRVISMEIEPGAEPVDDHGPGWHYDQSELGARLTRLVDTLPEPQKSLVVLFDMQGLSGEECARVIGLNVNQVKVYLHRARRRLRTKLEES